MTTQNLMYKYDITEEKEFIDYMQNHNTYKGKYTPYLYQQFKKSITSKLLQQ